VNAPVATATFGDLAKMASEVQRMAEVIRSHDEERHGGQSAEIFLVVEALKVLVQLVMQVAAKAYGADLDPAQAGPMAFIPKQLSSADLEAIRAATGLLQDEAEPIRSPEPPSFVPFRSPGEVCNVVGCDKLATKEGIFRGMLLAVCDEHVIDWVKP
jgi:hypothetical protein